MCRIVLGRGTRYFNVERLGQILGQILTNKYAVEDGTTIALLSIKLIYEIKHTIILEQVMKQIGFDREIK